MMPVPAATANIRQTTPPLQKAALLSPDSARFCSSYDYVKRSRSLTPSQTPSPSRNQQPIRRRLRDFETFDDAVQLVKTSKNVVILAGAGISTSVGIPDFRSKQGLYNKLNAKKRFAEPQQLFTSASFCDAPLEFYSDVMPIIPKLRTAENGGHIAKAEDVVGYVPRFGLTHAFIKLLHDKKRLLTIYTQNIDGLEKAAGVDPAHIINCHGSWDSATCLTCHREVSADEYLPVVYKRALPLCMCAKPIERDPAQLAVRPRRERMPKTEVPVEYLEATRSIRRSGSTPTLKKRKRANEDDAEDPVSRPGLLKPDITFFDEGISKAYSPRVLKDATKVDLFLIIGTSLPVEPVNKLPFEIPASVPQIWISREHCQRSGLKVDIELLGDCDLVVEELCRRAGWTTALENRRWLHKFGSRQQAKEQLIKLHGKKAVTNPTYSVARDVVSTPGDTTPRREVKIEVSPSFPVGTEGANISAEPSSTSSPRPVLIEDLPIRQPDDLPRHRNEVPKIERPASPTNAKAIPESKVRVEADLGTDWKWYIRRR